VSGDTINEPMDGRTRHRRTTSFRPTIGMFQSGLVDLYETQWIGAVDGAREQQANLVTFVGKELENPSGFDAQANVIYELADAGRLNGLIIWVSTLQVYVGAEKMEAFCRRFAGLPVVCVEQGLAGRVALLKDDRQGMYEAIDHLIGVHGCRRVAFVRGPETHEGAQQRYRGYLEALSDHGVPFDPSLVSAPPQGWHPEEAAHWVARLTDELPGGFDAIAAANDDMATGALSALQASGIKVPDDIALVGFDDRINVMNHDLGLEGAGSDSTGAMLDRPVKFSATTLPLTTVRAPFHELGRRAVELLLAQLRDEPVPEVTTIPTELVTRRSCGCFPLAVREPDGSGRRDAGPEEVAAELRSTLTVPDAPSAPDWPDRLLDAFLADVRGESPDTFLIVLDDLLRAGPQTVDALEGWWRVLLALRRKAPPDLPADALARTEALWLQTQALMRDTATRLYGYRHLLADKRDQIVRQVGYRLITTLDVGTLADVLAQELRNVGIPSCYLATYESDLNRPEAGRYPTPSSRAILAYENGRRIALAPGEDVFPSNELLPGGRLDDRERAFSLVALPLYFNDQQLGFALFEIGPPIGWMYQALQGHLSSALQGALLVEREKRALVAAEQEIHQRRAAEAALQRAHDQLEERVAERTAELVRANETLTEQMIERERAEAAQARLEAQLRQAQKMEAIGQLAGGIAHDFNNLLLVINGYTDLLLTKVGTEDPLRTDIQQILQAGERAATLTRQLLAFSRKQILEPRVLKLNEIVTNLEAMLRRLIGEDVELATTLSPSLAPVRADPGQIEQIIVNLAVNARDAMPRGGRLAIETANAYLDHAAAEHHINLKAGPYVTLTVSDTGVGMDANTQAHLFEPFFTTKPQGRGTGLGLATVFGIVQQSGGNITVASAPGDGTTFRIYLPQSVQAVDEREPEEVPPRSAWSGSETILLVEDDSGVRRAMRRFLEEYGYRVLEASRGSEALSLCEQHDGPVHLAVADVVIPGPSGPDLVERLARVRPELSVLYVSGRAADGTVTADGLPGAASSVLQKPFTAEALTRKVRELLDLKLDLRQGA
jgi:signal transduction histidine kinase/DNA-binding LacI/PurR family transcriptional regulator